MLLVLLWKILTQEEMFDILTNSGTSQGVFMEAGQIYVNASYIKSGTFVALDSEKGIVCSTR